MNITVVADRQVFERALRAARRNEESDDVAGLASILDAALLGRLEDAWDAVEAALREGYQFGKARADALFQLAIERVEDVIDRAGVRAADVHQEFLRRMQDFVQAHIAGTLARVPTVLEVGGERFSLATVKYTQTLMVTGSVKASLTETFALATSGQIQIGADYSTPTGGAVAARDRSPER